MATKIEWVIESERDDDDLGVVKKVTGGYQGEVYYYDAYGHIDQRISLPVQKTKAAAVAAVKKAAATERASEDLDTEGHGHGDRREGWF